MDARVVNKDDLSFVRCPDAEDTGSRGLWLIGDDGHLLAENVVEERRFPRIWASNECNVTDFHFFFHITMDRSGNCPYIINI